MEEKTDRRVRKTKEAIRSTFFELMKTKEYSNITVKELTAKADITRKTFYLHYGSLDDMLKKFFTEILMDLDEKVNNKSVMDENFDYLAFFTRLNEAFEQNKTIMRRLMSDPTSRNVLQQVNEEHERKAMGKYFDLYDLNPDIISIYISTIAKSVIAAYMEWVSSPNSLSLEEFSLAVKDLTDCSRIALEKHRKPHVQQEEAPGIFTE